MSMDMMHKNGYQILYMNSWVTGLSKAFWESKVALGAFAKNIGLAITYCVGRCYSRRRPETHHRQVCWRRRSRWRNRQRYCLKFTQSCWPLKHQPNHLHFDWNDWRNKMQWIDVIIGAKWGKGLQWMAYSFLNRQPQVWFVAYQRILDGDKVNVSALP